MTKQKKKKKAAKNEIEARISEIIKLILEGKSNVEIVTYVSKKYNVDERQAYNYLKDAYKRLELVNCSSIFASGEMKKKNFRGKGKRMEYNIRFKQKEN